MLGVLALVLQVGVAAPTVAAGLCDGAPAAMVETRASFRTLLAAAVQWVRRDQGVSGRPATTCVPLRPAVVRVPAPRSVLAPSPSRVFTLPRAHSPCDDNTDTLHDDQPDTQRSYRPLPDWVPPYAAFWVPEPEVSFVRFPIDPECDDSLTAALSGGAELAFVPRRLSGRPGL